MIKQLEAPRRHSNEDSDEVMTPQVVLGSEHKLGLYTNSIGLLSRRCVLCYAQGVVLDGFPSTQVQGVSMEKLLSGVDLEMERAIGSTVSRLAPPPADYLPDPDRQLTSGLDAVFLLELSDEQTSLERSLGRRRNQDGLEVHLGQVDPDEKDSIAEANELQV